MTADTQLVRPSNGSIHRAGFGETSIERRAETAAVAVAARAEAEVKARYVMAYQRPRDVGDFRYRLLKHAERPGWATRARYAKPVGGVKIEGPSIRFVETALAEYGNVLPESSIVYEDDDKMIVRVTVTDLERNVTHANEVAIKKTVERSTIRQGQEVVGERQNTQGRTVYIIRATDDDLANKKAAAESKMIRNLGLRILPADIVDEAQNLCIETMKNDAAKDPAAERKRVADAFSSLGIPPSELARYLGHPLDQLVPKEAADLRAVFAAIRDGEGTWPELLALKLAENAPAVTSEPQAEAPAQRGTEGVKAKLASRKTKPAAAAPLVEKTAPEEVADDAADPATTARSELDKAVRSLFDGLEVALAEPHRLPDLRDRINRLPPGVDKTRLATLLEKTEIALAEDRAKDEPPFGG